MEMEKLDTGSADVVFNEVEAGAAVEVGIGRVWVVASCEAELSVKTGCLSLAWWAAALALSFSFLA